MMLVKMDAIPDWQALLANDTLENKPLSPPTPFYPSDSWSGARFWRWNAPAGSILWKTWPADGPDETTHRNRHAALNLLTDFRPILALPIPDARGSTLRCMPQGSFAEMFRWLDGMPAPSRPNDAQIHDVATFLARLHARWRATGTVIQGPSPAIVSRLARLRSLADGGLAAFERRIESPAQGMPGSLHGTFREILRNVRLLVHQAVRRLEPLAERRYSLQFVLRDVRPPHFLMDGDKVVALVDFGAVGVDSIAVDLARLCGEWFPEDQSRLQKLLISYSNENPGATECFGLIEPLILSGSILGGLAWADAPFAKKRTAGRAEAFDRSASHALDRLRAQVDHYLDRSDARAKRL